MNADVKAKWVTALRSGEYQQGKGTLAQTDDTGAMRYCCLGVLSEIAAQEGITTRVPSDEHHEDGVDCKLTWYGNGFAGSSFLPDEVVEWAGLPHNDPKIDGEHLSSLNDNGASFTSIAEIIEESL